MSVCTLRERCESSHRDAARAEWEAWIRNTNGTPHAPHTGRAILISYEYPPTGGSGAQRPSKLARYLPACGWSVDVITAAHQRFPWNDTSLERWGESESVLRVEGWEPACLAPRVASACPTSTRQWVEDRLYWRMVRLTERLGLGNGESLWVASAARKALQKHSEAPFDVVITTGPPHFVHRIGRKLATRTGVPWVADVRDPLVSDFDRQQRDPAVAARNTRLESSILQHASAVVTTCQSLADDLRQRYPRRAGHVHVITNGFDRADIAPLAGTVFPLDVCTFVAAGAFYGRRDLGRVVRPLRRVMQAHPEWMDRVRLTVAGTLDTQQHRYWTRHRPEWMDLAGYVPHTEALRLEMSAACNIVIVPDCDHGRASIPGKLFELLALPAHILMLAPNGSEAARIGVHAGACTQASLESERSAAAAMERIAAQYFAGRLEASRQWTALDSYDRRAVAGRFADVLRAACSRNGEETRASLAVPEKA